MDVIDGSAVQQRRSNLFYPIRVLYARMSQTHNIDEASRRRVAQGKGFLPSEKWLLPSDTRDTAGAAQRVPFRLLNNCLRFASCALHHEFKEVTRRPSVRSAK